MSRRHATWDGDHCLITDQGSLNGTYLNGQRIASSCRLAHGDTLQIGMFRIAFLEPDTNGSGTTPPWQDR